ncbi:MAG: sulfatase, partial [Planctomycetes bacterium]|nr:sulfatase [Planctomycetota bacterium]
PAAPAGGGPLLFPDAPLVIISVDTLRADRLGAYGYGRGTTPRLDALAAESVLFEECLASGCKTAESHMSLFTSLPPTVHGVHNYSPRLQIEPRALGENRLTLPQVLRRAGRFNTGVACGGQLVAPMGFGRGFEGRFTSELVDVSAIVDRSLDAVDASLAQERPWMLFAHTYQVHGPYLPPRAFRERFAPDLRGTVGERVRQLEGLPFGEQWKAMFPVFWKDLHLFGAEDARMLSDLYDGEVAYTDQQLGRFLDGLKSRGVYDDAILVVLSDHGEEFGEHGHFEHDQLYRELLHVPLLVRLPGGRLGGTRVAGQCGLIDVMPTLLELLALEGPETMAGRSLVPAMTSGRAPGDAVLSERLMFAESYAASLRTPDTTLLYRFDPTSMQSDERPGPGPEPGRPAGEGRIEVYDRRADPGEQRDLGSGAPDWEAATTSFHRRLAALFEVRARLDDVASGAAVSLSAEQVEELVKLGYTGTGSAQLPAGTPLDRWPAHAGR